MFVHFDMFTISYKIPWFSRVRILVGFKANALPHGTQVYALSEGKIYLSKLRTGALTGLTS